MGDKAVGWSECINCHWHFPAEDVLNGWCRWCWAGLRQMVDRTGGSVVSYQDTSGA